MFSISLKYFFKAQQHETGKISPRKSFLQGSSLFSLIPRLKKKKQAKQNADTASAIATRTHTGKEDSKAVILEQDKCNIAVEEEYISDEKKKRKSNQLKEIRRTELKRYYSTGECWWYPS